MPPYGHPERELDFDKEPGKVSSTLLLFLIYFRKFPNKHKHLMTKANRNTPQCTRIQVITSRFGSILIDMLRLFKAFIRRKIRNSSIEQRITIDLISW